MAVTAQSFAPHDVLAVDLLPHAADTTDGSHDLAHILRVFRNAMRIHAAEGGDGDVLAAAVLLHDCVAVEKNSPLRSQASKLAAEKASAILRHLGWPEVKVVAVAHAILTHSFSANIPPESLEAKILQDADRLDAIGMVGAARCFYVAGRLGSQLYDPADPRAERRAIDDRRYSIDHFPAKLFRLADGFQTAAGAALARERHQRLEKFYDLFLEEIS
jgi:uncharacterized protein